MRRSLLVLVVAVAASVSACLPPAPAPAPDPTAGTNAFDRFAATYSTAPQTSSPGSSNPGSSNPGSSTPVPGANAFDTCAAPSSSTMTTWKQVSPFNILGVYIGGANKGCAQPNLTKNWVSTVVGQGWKLLPLWVGPQASCTTLHGTTKLSTDVIAARYQGNAEATAAADAADALFGPTWLTPIYYDMEGYARSATCSGSVQSFSNGWVETLNKRGYQAGFYSSLCSGVVDLAVSYDNPDFARVNAIWIAAWNDKPNIYGFGPPCALGDGYWPDHRRVHQFSGGHNETWGGVKINIDSDASDGPTFG